MNTQITIANEEIMRLDIYIFHVYTEKQQKIFLSQFLCFNNLPKKPHPNLGSENF